MPPVGLSGEEKSKSLGLSRVKISSSRLRISSGLAKYDQSSVSRTGSVRMSTPL